ncbi:hypothetical protein F5887DRAFT_922080 [Amanita rubescens]|nr:hypothetical protein F5887DRAFT_922080 [Amanita rubescens]
MMVETTSCKVNGRHMVGTGDECGGNDLLEGAGGGGSGHGGGKNLVGGRWHRRLLQWKRLSVSEGGGVAGAGGRGGENNLIGGHWLLTGAGGERGENESWPTGGECGGNESFEGVGEHRRWGGGHSRGNDLMGGCWWVWEVDILEVTLSELLEAVGLTGCHNHLHAVFNLQWTASLEATGGGSCLLLLLVTHYESVTNGFGSGFPNLE